MKRMTMLLVLLALLLSACAKQPEPSTQPSAPTVPNTTAPTQPTVPQIEFAQSGPVKLTKVATFDHAGNLMFAYGDFVLRYDRDNAQAPYQLLSPLGEAQLTGNYNAASYCGNGIALVAQPGESYDPVGLVDYRNGQVLAQCEALRILQISQRYFLMVYVETTVAEEENAFSFYTDKNGGVVYYDGYATVLDVTTGSIVPDLKLETMPSEVGTIGDCFYICNGNLTEIYNADGTLALSMVGGTVKDGVAIYSTFGGVSVFDSSLQQVSQLKFASQRLTIVDGGYLRFYDDGAYQLLDLLGNAVMEELFQEIRCVSGDLVVARKETGWGITTLTGEEVLPHTYRSVEDLGDGKFLLEDGQGKKFLYSLDGTMTEADALSGNGWYYYSEDENGRQYLLQNGETMTFTAEVNEMDFGLVSTEAGLYELHTGGELLSGYDRYAYCDGYVYARCNGIWTVFQVEITK